MSMQARYNSNLPQEDPKKKAQSLLDADTSLSDDRRERIRQSIAARLEALSKASS